MAVYIDKELCKSCQICVKICPRGVFAITNRVNKKGYNYVTVINEDKCIACGQCEKVCPDFVIHIEKIDEGNKYAE